MVLYLNAWPAFKEHRIAVAVVRFSDTAKVQFGFGKYRSQNDILYELERIERTGGRTSITAGIDATLLEIARNRRPDARLVVILISDGNSQDPWQLVQDSARKLRRTGGEIYAVTLSREQNFLELTEYAGNARRVYVGNRINHFIEVWRRFELHC
ncbi:unnamed protein product [Gongylonema pulchrum]|uniref:VWFA domain-containing protein n=1 Tax=Gongylonema pulchrum TaxID=637853 RepID=A0A183ERW6_9BILA|nr:unnamed protein product [Gongylonema pulchrum]